jgi:hypothetical protein
VTKKFWEKKFFPELLCNIRYTIPASVVMSVSEASGDSRPAVWAPLFYTFLSRTSMLSVPVFFPLLDFQQHSHLCRTFTYFAPGEESPWLSECGSVVYAEDPP